MKTILLVSGSLRSFRENLQSLPNWDIAVYVSRGDEDTYLHKDNYAYLFEDPRIKYLMFETLPEIPSCYVEERQRNVYKQWYKCYRLFQCVPDTYDWYVRMRPDVRLMSPIDIPHESTNMIYIPHGNDRLGINDQLAYGSYAQMSHYMCLWKSMFIDPTRTSEETLKHHLRDIPIQRVSLQYRLMLSNIKVIAITGDSGSGKSTFCRLVRPFFLFDKVMEFETDRYHKWERGHERWNTMSHLNPAANYLEKLEEDTFNLKLGNTIVSVEYDHKTGTFTPPQTLEPKENIMLCGLHTLYSKQLRTLSDLKLYIDTSDELKIQWKLKRDMEERGHSQDKILTSIESRRPDYEMYVSPQKEHADIVIQLSSTNLILRYQTGLSYEWVREFPCDIDGSMIVFSDPNVDARLAIRRFIVALDLPPVDAAEEKLGFNGILQLMFIRALYG